MQNMTNPDSLTTDARTKRGMAWIGKTLEAIAKDSNVQIKQWTWILDPTAAGERLYSLIVVSNRHKRAIKLFSKMEIDQCPTDKILQEEVQLRLNGILAFIGPNH